MHYKACFANQVDYFTSKRVSVQLREWIDAGAPGCTCEEEAEHYERTRQYGKETWSVSDYVNSTR